MRCGAVYIARGLTSGLVKIGFSHNARWRVRSLTVEAREPLEVLAAFPARGLRMEHERAMHRRFAALLATDSGRGREWFRDDGSIAAFVASLPAHQRGSYFVRAPGKHHRGPAHPRPPAWLVNANVLPLAHPASPSHNPSHGAHAHARIAPRGGCGSAPHRDSEVCA